MALAGVAGVISAPITGAYPSMGDNLLLLTLIVVVVGGTGYIQEQRYRAAVYAVITVTASDASSAISPSGSSARVRIASIFWPLDMRPKVSRTM